ncbi:hypothetical protein [Methylobacterium sp. Leaf108]|uniref:hypothetical protein n=1 Tax=Methylobacterium sp. Leaf108 TaxID=1736256 RepID=UPI0006F27E65|nr:hypothetical protein [Methylobacterium sp. Leaf108]KQP56356.1 nonribosomal peptide synthetase MxaA [Methylobacterium sp. Leaf108]
MRRAVSTSLVPLVLASSMAGPVQAQVRAVEVRAPRAFGYMLGDLVRAQVDIVVEDGFAIQAASLPQRGALAYWLDLRDIAVSQADAGDARRVRLDLTYQTFYAALDVRSLEVPGFTVSFVSQGASGATTASARVPAWTFTISPLREILPPAKENPQDYMRPDGRVASLDPRPTLFTGLGFAGLALAAFAGLARDRTWWPFRVRRGRAFAAARRRLRGLGGRPDAAEAYREALLALHRGLDETDGRRVLADDLDRFLDRHPAYRGQAPGLVAFFEASRIAFFGNDTARARGRLARPEIAALAARLARAERTA